MDINDYLKKLREDRGLSQRGLALKMGVSNSTISQIENKRNKPSIDILFLYSGALNIDVIKIIDKMKTDEELVKDVPDNAQVVTGTLNIPLLGTVRGGKPILADQNIESYITINKVGLCPDKVYFALKVKGDSMDKVFPENTTLVVEKTDAIENNQIAVIGVNGYEATVKKITLADKNIALIPQSNNPAYTTTVYNIEKDEIHIMGRVVQAITYF